MLATILGLAAALGVQATPVPGTGDGPAAASGVAALPTPYTADQIRDEWTQGFEVVLRRKMPAGTTTERLRVVEWRPDGVVIASAVLDADGRVQGEERKIAATWTELRDHARFPVFRARREEVTRRVALGEYQGWLYTVDDPEDKTTTRFFFPHDLPGAPAWMEMTRGGTPVMTLEQIERRHPR